MVKRNKLEIIKDILIIIKENNTIRPTPLLRKANISSGRSVEYFNELIKKRFIEEKIDKDGNKFISLREKGLKFLEKYKTIIEFIDEFEL
ncbi:hypothetical protein COX99_03545 [Candidatus Pacearchaeota archaeon CG_4_10_14_0_2_um_filter_31_10]|nr:MAG: hypothetical protein COU55_02210 [Candidatus Pacearchaeota archaeon CG10_big_fil_rev_8_21_14_0_10_31_59]PIZ79863.1 MAG: hypothetical protein COX99_03545 [Candidatus Pacearchaeota archaeon CG_4_10_14_0_2_um_filter_31_10]